MVEVSGKGVTSSNYTALKTKADTRLHGTISKALIFNAFKCLTPQYETLIPHRHSSTSRVQLKCDGTR